MLPPAQVCYATIDEAAVAGNGCLLEHSRHVLLDFLAKICEHAPKIARLKASFVHAYDLISLITNHEALAFATLQALYQLADISGALPLN